MATQPVVQVGKVSQSTELPSPLTASSHLSIGAAWLAIGFLWTLTPLSWAYVIWNLITILPSLSAGRPAPHGALGVTKGIILVYACLEVLFSCYYRYLAWRAQVRRPPTLYTREFLRTLLKRGLENGPDTDADGLDTNLRPSSPGRSLSSRQRPEPGSAAARFSFEAGVRKRSWLGRESAATPDASTADSEPSNTPAPASDSLLGGLARAMVAPLPTQLHTRPTSEARSARSADTKGSLEPDVVASKASHARSFLPTAHEFADSRAVDFRNYIRVWFSSRRLQSENPEFEEIRRKDMADWVGWSLYGVPLEELELERAEWISKGRPVQYIGGVPDLDEGGLEIEKDKLGLVEHCVDLVEHRAVTRFAPGRNPAVKVIRLTLDPVRVYSRPLILYVFVWLATKAVTVISERHGFKEVRDDDTRYLLRIPEGWKPDPDSMEAERPLLFIHGLGMGLVQYATLVNCFWNNPTLKARPLMVLIQPWVSMAFFSKGYLDPPDMHTSTAGLRRAAGRHAFDKCGMTVLSHSNGTIVHGWLIKGAPELCRRSCMVDPVTFCLWEPWVCFQFLYSKCQTPIDYLTRYFVGRELGVANLLQRRFDWSANLLFPTDIPNHTDPHKAAFFLAGRDAILSPQRIRNYLKRHGVTEAPDGRGVGEGWGGLKFYRGRKHGESIIRQGCGFDQIMRWVTTEEDEVVDGREWEM